MYIVFDKVDTAFSYNEEHWSSALISSEIFQGKRK